MIHGPGVMMKYNVILDGRRLELLAGVPKSDHDSKLDGLVEFLDSVRNSTSDEFEQWYQLYK